VVPVIISGYLARNRPERIPSLLKRWGIRTTTIINTSTISPNIVEILINKGALEELNKICTNNKLIIYKILATKQINKIK